MDDRSETAAGDPSATVSSDALATASLSAAAGPIEMRLADRYRLVDVLGSGGMGVVFRAFDERLRRWAAIKVVRGRGQHERLLREARTMARVGHPGVVPVYDVLETEHGQVQVVMELIDGGTLGGWLRETRRPWREVVARFLAAGRALVAAHGVGVIHRDFKPENVLLARDGRVLVSDFGLASVRPDDPAQTNAIDITRSGTGGVAGTPAYMAPEQFAGEVADARSDQFAFCVALWEGVFGRRPFETDERPGTERLERLRARVLMGDRSAPPAGHDVPAALVRSLERGLAVQPDERWPSLDELLSTLTELAVPRRRWSAVLAFVSVLVASAAIAVAWRPWSAPSAAGSPSSSSNLRVSRSHQLVSFPSKVFWDVALAGDGTLYETRGLGVTKLSPDGSTREFTADGVILGGVVVSSDGTPHVLQRLGTGRSRVSAILPDGTIVRGPVLDTGEESGFWKPFAVGPSDIAVVANAHDVRLFAGGQLRWTIASDASVLAMSPDGTRVAIGERHDDHPLEVVIVAADDGHAIARIPLGETRDVAMTWRGADLLAAIGTADGYSLLALPAADDFRPRSVHVGAGRPLALAANDRGVVLLDDQKRSLLQIGGVSGTPASIRLSPAVRLSVKPSRVLGFLSTGEVAIAVAPPKEGAEGIRAVDERGQLRELDAPDHCNAVGLWRDRPVCQEKNGDQLTLRGRDSTVLGAVTGDGISGVTCIDDNCYVLVFRGNRAVVHELVVGKPPRALGLQLDADGYVTEAVGAVARSPNGMLAAADCHQITLSDGQRPAVYRIENDGSRTWNPCAVAWVDDRSLLVAQMEENFLTRLSLRDPNGIELASAPLGLSWVLTLAVAPMPGSARFALVGTDQTTAIDELELTRD